MSEIAKLVFGDESKKLIFEDLQPKLVFADEFKKLIFDVIQEIAGVFDSTFDSTFN